MPPERNHRYEKDKVSFRLYSDPVLSAARELQETLFNNSRADHGLRFTKFFGRWADEERQKSDDNGLVLLKEVHEFKEVEQRQGNQQIWRQKDNWIKTDPLLDWLDPTAQPGTRLKGNKSGLTVGDAGRLAEADERLKRLAEAQMMAHFAGAADTDNATFDMDLVSRLFTGIGSPHPTENGFLFHPTLAVPYLRGTALKQVARDWAEEEALADRDELARIFGGKDSADKDKGAGCLAFLDALPKAPVTLTAEQITSHYGPYYQTINPATGQRGPDGNGHSPDFYEPADWHEPNPVTLLAVDAAFDRPLRFRFAILPLRGAKESDLKAARDWLTKGLEITGAGARTTLGFGRFESVETKKEREQNRPLAAGDRVRITKSFTKKTLHGKAGEVETVFQQGSAKLKLDGGGKGASPVVPLRNLERI